MDCFTANFRANMFCNQSSADVQSLCSLLQPLALYSLYLSHLGTTIFPHCPFLAEELQQLGYLHAAYLLSADALRLRRACNCPLMPPTLSSAASPEMTISFMKSSKFLRFRVSPEGSSFQVRTWSKSFQALLACDRVSFLEVNFGTPTTYEKVPKHVEIYIHKMKLHSMTWIGRC